jgi:hypothetical protein
MGSSTSVKAAPHFQHTSDVVIERGWYDTAGSETMIGTRIDGTTVADDFTVRLGIRRKPALKRAARRLCACFAGAVAAMLLAGPPVGLAASGVNLLPHVARYNLNRHHADIASGIAAVKGSMEVRFEISCDGFRVEQYLGFRLLSDDENQLEHLAYISSFEDADGRGFWFNTKTYEDRKLTEEIGGRAALEDSGGGNARYSLPSKAVEPLPKGTLFPIRHLRAIISAAKAGQKSVRHTVFDGSTRENPFEISTFIGTGNQESEKHFGALRDVKQWPVRLAYFPVGAVNLTPPFQMSANLYENGVIGNMIYDYGNFAIGVELDEVEALPKPEC